MSWFDQSTKNIEESSSQVPFELRRIKMEDPEEDSMESLVTIPEITPIITESEDTPNIKLEKNEEPLQNEPERMSNNFNSQEVVEHNNRLVTNLTYLSYMDNKRYECELCNKYFKSPAFLRVHLSKKHFKSGNDVSFNNEFSFDSPKIESPNNSLKMENLNQQPTTAMSNMINAIKVEQELDISTEMPTSPPENNDNTTDQYYLENILIDSNKFTCKLCRKAFKTKKDCIAHLKYNCTKMVQQRYECEICHEIFEDKADLLYHASFHTETVEYKCHLCNKVYPKRSALAHHMPSHDRKKCTVCGETVKASFLTRHMLKHSDKIDCPICGIQVAKAFISEHIKGHRNQGIHCVCKRKFVSQHDLIKHQKFYCPLLHKKSQHYHDYYRQLSNGNNSSITNPCSSTSIQQLTKKYVCNNCGQIFTDNTSYEIHLQSDCLQNEQNNFPTTSDDSSSVPSMYEAPEEEMLDIKPNLDELVPMST